MLDFAATFSKSLIVTSDEHTTSPAEPRLVNCCLQNTANYIRDCYYYCYYYATSHAEHRCGLLKQMSHIAWSVCLWICHSEVLCKNGWTNWDAIWRADSCGSNESYIRWGSRSNESIHSWVAWKMNVPFQHKNRLHWRQGLGWRFSSIRLRMTNDTVTSRLCCLSAQWWPKMGKDKGGHEGWHVGNLSIMLAV